MLGPRRGFVFSLDSFVAFSLILIAVQSLVVISSAPAGYYHSLAQTNFIAQDTMEVLSHVKYENGKKDLFSDGAAAALSGSPSIANRLIKETNNLIPDPFSYSYDYYDLESNLWRPIYNASGGSCAPPSSRFCNVTFHRVQSASSMFVGVYSDPIEAGDSPNCNVVCTGYVPGDGPTEAAACDKVTCDNQIKSTFDPGDFRLGILRLRVWG